MVVEAVVAAVTDETVAGRLQVTRSVTLSVE